MRAAGDDDTGLRGLRAFYVTVAIHGAIALLLLSLSPPPPPAPPIDVAIRRISRGADARSAAARPADTPPAIVPRDRARRQVPRTRTGTAGTGRGVAIPNSTPAPPTDTPPPPSVGLSLDSVTQSPSAPAMPVGNTTIGAKAGLSTAPLPEAGGGTGGFGAPAAFALAPTPPIIVGNTCEIPDSQYPLMARRFGIEGRTELRIDIDPKGKVTRVVITRSAFPTLDEVAVDWVKTHCRFKPARDQRRLPTDGILFHTVEWKIGKQ